MQKVLDLSSFEIDIMSGFSATVGSIFSGVWSFVVVRLKNLVVVGVLGELGFDLAASCEFLKFKFRKTFVFFRVGMFETLELFPML